MSDGAARTPSGNELIGTLTKDDGVKVQRVALDHDDFVLPSVPLFNQINTPDTELPDGPKVAQGGGANTITLAADASSVNGYYVGMRIYQNANNGVYEDRLCIAYDGVTKVATVDSSWTVQPINGTNYDVFLDCYGKSIIRVKASYSLPSQNGAFMKAKFFIKLYDANRKLVFGRPIEPMSLLKFTYATTGYYLSPTPPHTDDEGRAACEVIDVPIIKGVKNFRVALDGYVYQCNTWSAPANKNTIAQSGNAKLYVTAV